MRSVSKDEFYGPIYAKGLNVHPSIVNGKWPYTSVFRFLNNPHAVPYGKVVGLPDGSKEYYLSDGY